MQSTYTKLDPSSSPNISTVPGSGSPVAIRDLNIGWYDNNGQYYSFVLKNVFHIPKSPVNVLGLCAFSKSIGDYNNGGTRINSSGTESILSCNNKEFWRCLKF